MSNLFRDNIYNEFPDPNKQIEELGEQVDNVVDQASNAASDLAQRAVNILYPPPPLVAPKGDGVTDDRLAIQAIIDSGVAAIYVPDRTFLVSHNGQTYAGKGTGVGLKLRSNLRIYGVGTIKYKGGQAGNLAVMASITDTIENCHIEGITIDGNKANLNAGASVSNAVMFGAKNCSYINVKSIDASYCGLMFRGAGTENNIIERCNVTNSSYIGIQCQNHNIVKILHNTVRDSGDNGIDIEGNDSAGGLLNRGYGKQIIVQGNVINNANSGIFVESAGEVIVNSNHVYNTNVGAFINRINSGSYMNGITSNHFINMPWQSGVAYKVGDRIVTGSKLYECTVAGTASVAPSHTSGTASDGTLTWKWLRTFPSNYGMRFNNNVGDGQVVGNQIRGFLYGVRCVSAASYLTFDANYFSDIEKYLFAPATAANSFIKSQIGVNYYRGSQTGGFPKTMAPTTESPSYSSRVLNVGIKPVISLETNAVLRDTFYYKTGNTDSTRSGWGGAYAIFNSGETKVYIPGAGLVVGEYIKINGTFYYVQANSSSEITIRTADTKVAGDFTATVNGNYSVQVYSAGEYTALITD
jgi:hypothetical protein